MVRSAPAAAAVLAVHVLLALAPAPAAAAEPVLPLDGVRPGLRCTALTVVRGTEPVPFDVEVLDVVRGDPAARQPLILIRVAGPAVADTGIAEGFSGSPVLCPDGQGRPAVAGAISYGLGDYGNRIGLATPIEAVLGQPLEPPAAARPAPALLRRARPLRSPLAVRGLSPPVAAVLARAARRAGRPLVPVPALPVAAGLPPQRLRPGSAMAVGLASGDVGVGAVGTVTYVDGDRVWGFGHPFEGVGRRSLLLQDAYVFTVLANPVGVGEAVSQKLAAPGNDLGTLTADGPDTVAGRLGALPPRIPLAIALRDADTGARQVVRAQVADETALGLPGGTSALSVVAPTALAQAAYATLRGAPAALSGSMCVRVTVRERRRPLGFCNRYVGAGGGPGGGDGEVLPGAALAGDLATAIGELDAFVLGRLTVTGVYVRAELARGLRAAELLRARGPRVVRRGAVARVRLVLQRIRGPRIERVVRVRIPRDARLGARELLFAGRSIDDAGRAAEAFVDDLSEVLGGDEGGGEEPDTGGGGARTVDGVARRIARIGRADDLRVGLVAPGGRRGSRRRALPDGGLRISGSARLAVRIRR